MSEENVELVRRLVEAWQRDDLDAWLSMLHSEVEWQPALERVMGGAENSYRGLDGMRQFWKVYRTEVDDFRFELQDVRDVGDGRVLALAHGWFRGPKSGIELDSPVGLVVTLRDGKVLRSVDYLSHEEALEAVGLRG